MSKTLAILLIIIIAGAWYASQHINITQYIDKYTGRDEVTHGDEKVTVYVDIAGQGGFITESGKLLSLYDSKTGEELKKYTATYTATLTLEPKNATITTITMTLTLKLTVTLTQTITLVDEQQQSLTTTVTVTATRDILSMVQTIREQLTIKNNTILVMTQTLQVLVSATIKTPAGQTIQYNKRFVGSQKDYKILYRGEDSTSYVDEQRYNEGWEKGKQNGYKYYWSHKVPLQYTLEDRMEVEVGYSGEGDPYEEGYREGFIYGYTDAYIDDMQSGLDRVGPGNPYWGDVPMIMTIVKTTNTNTNTIITILAAITLTTPIIILAKKHKH